MKLNITNQTRAMFYTGLIILGGFICLISLESIQYGKLIAVAGVWFMVYGLWNLVTLHDYYVKRIVE